MPVWRGLALFAEVEQVGEQLGRPFYGGRVLYSAQ